MQSSLQANTNLTRTIDEFLKHSSAMPHALICTIGSKHEQQGKLREEKINRPWVSHQERTQMTLDVKNSQYASPSHDSYQVLGNTTQYF